MLLTTMVFLPLVGALAIVPVRKEKAQTVRAIAFVTGAIVFGLSLWAWFHLPPSDGQYGFVERASWISRFNIQYYVGIDTLGAAMLVLTALLCLVAMVNAFQITERVKEFFIFFLVLQSAMLGVFVSLDLFLFYVFWELTLIPLYFLIGIWGGPKKQYAAIKFFLFTFFGSVFMLVAMIAIYVKSHSFDLPELAAQASSWPLTFQQWIFLGFFIAFAVKIPSFPFHTWLPLAHVEAPTPISVILAGVLLKMGGYGLIRFAWPLAPAAAKEWSFALGVLATISIVYGALCALVQRDMKRMIAYSSVAHMGIVLLGIASMHFVGLCGAAYQMVAHGIITGALFLLVGVLYDRTHTRDMDQFGELALRMPVYATFMITACFASLGMPLLAGFVPEFLSFLGAFQVPAFRSLAVISLAGVLLTAAFFLLMIRRVFFAPVRRQWEALADLNAREWLTIGPLMALALLLGLFPGILLDPISQAFGGRFG